MYVYFLALICARLEVMRQDILYMGTDIPATHAEKISKIITMANRNLLYIYGNALDPENYRKILEDVDTVMHSIYLATCPQISLAMKDLEKITKQALDLLNNPVSMTLARTTVGDKVVCLKAFVEELAVVADPTTTPTTTAPPKRVRKYNPKKARKIAKQNVK